MNQQTNCCTKPDPTYYYVLAIAGGGNAQGMGEAMPKLGVDFQDSRVKQLGRFTDDVENSSITSDSLNNVIPAGSTLHGVMDLRNNNHTDQVEDYQRGLVSLGQYIGVKLLESLPDDAGILLVPCTRPESSFNENAPFGSYKPQCGADAASQRWGIDTPLYFDLRDRVRYALDNNENNMFLGTVWSNGEAEEFPEDPDTYGASLVELIDTFRDDINQTHAKQCVGEDANLTPFIIAGGTAEGPVIIDRESSALAYDKEAVDYLELSRDEFPDYVVINNGEDAGADDRVNSHELYFSSDALRTFVSDRITNAILSLTLLPWVYQTRPEGEQRNRILLAQARELVLNREADHIFSLERTSEGVDILTNGPKVSALLSKGRTSSVAEQHTDDLRPEIVSGINQDVMQFDDAQRLITDVDLNKTVTVTVVFRLLETPSPGGTTNGIFGNDDGVGWDRIVYYNDGELAIGGTSESNPIVITGHSTINQWRVLSVSWGGQGYAYVNGKREVSFDSNTPDGTAAMMIGAINDGGGVVFNGQISEVHIHERQLSDLDVRTLHESLRQRLVLPFAPLDLTD